jgi:hypothetical protein
VRVRCRTAGSSAASSHATVSAVRSSTLRECQTGPRRVGAS